MSLACRLGEFGNYTCYCLYTQIASLKYIFNSLEAAFSKSFIYCIGKISQDAMVQAY